MSNPIISVENLGKCYQISHERQQSYTALRDVITQKTKDAYKSIFDRGNRTTTVTEDFWALKNVSFDINEGEAIGVIGRNGAGKSTLLKLLSRITEPTTGRIVLNGRVASLLEVGTGFHPELSGRENIYLNGSILGMSRKEIKAKFDEIVDFSGVEKFLDTPVKRYSSGMYVRLAFSVAAHMEPEILIVDEVLAVGDTEFQKKCLGKMSEISKNEGRTVLFVSHNMAVMRQLCSKLIYLNQGMIVGYDNSDKIISQYLDSGAVLQYDFPVKNKNVFFAAFGISSKKNDYILPGGDVQFEFSLQVNMAESIKVQVAFGINDKYGYRLITPFTRNNDTTIILNPGLNSVVCEIESLMLKPGVYNLHLFVGSEYEAIDYIDNGVSFEVAPYNYYSSFMPDDSQGCIIVDQKWYKK